jgi:hypothetical protein
MPWRSWLVRFGELAQLPRARFGFSGFLELIEFPPPAAASAVICLSQSSSNQLCNNTFNSARSREDSPSIARLIS